MTLHNPKDWFTVVFNFKRTDTFKKLAPMVLIIGLYSGVVCYFEINYFEVSKDSTVRNLTSLHALLGFAISLLLAYRTNTAYERWWEARKVWGNLLVRSRNLSIIISSLNDKSESDYFKANIISFAKKLAQHLTKNDNQTDLDKYDLNNILHGNINEPLQITKSLYNRIVELFSKDKISISQFNHLYNEIQSMNEICGVCERIKTSPIPYTYNIFLKKFLFFYIMSMPFGYALTLGYYTIPVVVFIFYVLTSLEMIAQEIEDPFGSESNDLPIEAIASIIEKNVEEIFSE